MCRTGKNGHTGRITTLVNETVDREARAKFDIYTSFLAWLELESRVFPLLDARAVLRDGSDALTCALTV